MIEGSLNFLNAIINNNKKFVIVSNTLKQNIDFFSELFPILKYSSKNYYREILKNKKPHPECYLKVIDDFPKKKKVCFEDSLVGIHACSQVHEIDMYFINTTNYIYCDYIINNYKINQIENYNNIL